MRTPEYVVFDDVQRHPWECVRGMDQSFGYNRNSGPDHFLSDGELLEMTGDIVAKGGNLLLNVGPKGEDATIPDRQLSLLGTLGNWTGSQGASIFASRPWIRPVGESVEGHGLRYWARDRSLFVAVDQRGGSSSRGGAADSTVTLREVAPSPTTVVRTASGEPVTHTDAPEGLQCVWTPSVPWSVLEITDARCR